MSHRAVWLTGLTALALLVGLGLYLAPLKPNLVALQFAFSPESFRSILTTWGPGGVALFRSHLPADGFLLLSYGAFGHLLVLRTNVFSQQTAGGKLRVALILPLAALADASENLLHWLLTANGADYSAAVYLLAGACASLKWLGIVAFSMAVVVAMLGRGKRRV